MSSRGDAPPYPTCPGCPFLSCRRRSQKTRCRTSGCSGPGSQPCACPPLSLCPQKEDSDKPVSDQWLDSFVIVDEEDKPVGTIEDGA